MLAFMSLSGAMRVRHFESRRSEAQVSTTLKERFPAYTHGDSVSREFAYELRIAPLKRGSAWKCHLAVVKLDRTRFRECEARRAAFFSNVRAPGERKRPVSTADRLCLKSLALAKTGVHALFKTALAPLRLCGPTTVVHGAVPPAASSTVTVDATPITPPSTPPATFSLIIPNVTSNVPRAPPPPSPRAPPPNRVLETHAPFAARRVVGATNYLPYLGRKQELSEVLALVERLRRCGSDGCAEGGIAEDGSVRAMFASNEAADRTFGWFRDDEDGRHCSTLECSWTRDSLEAVSHLYERDSLHKMLEMPYRHFKNSRYLRDRPTGWTFEVFCGSDRRAAQRALDEGCELHWSRRVVEAHPGDRESADGLLRLAAEKDEEAFRVLDEARRFMERARARVRSLAEAAEADRRDAKALLQRRGDAARGGRRWASAASARHARAEERARRGGAPQPRDHSTFHSSWPPRSSFPAAERRTYATSP